MRKFLNSIEKSTGLFIDDDSKYNLHAYPLLSSYISSQVFFSLSSRKASAFGAKKWGKTDVSYINLMNIAAGSNDVENDETDTLMHIVEIYS